MRFTLQCAGAALASSLMLSACTGGVGSSSAIPGGSTVSSPGGHSKGGYHLVRIGGGMHTDAVTCPTNYTCYSLDAGTSTQAGWCLSTTGNCTSGVYTGRVKWSNTMPQATCMPTQTYDLTKDKCTARVTSAWGPPRTVIGLILVTYTAKTTAKSGSGFDASWSACAVSGSIKGDCFGPNDTAVLIN